MKEAGCIRLGIGIESGNDEILRRINKSMSKTKVIKVVEWLKEIKLPFEGFFLLGLPNENWQTSMETIDFATKLNPKFPVFGIVVPYPGTELYNIARGGKDGYRIIAAGWSDYNKVIGKAMELEGLSRKKLELLQFYAYASVLIRNGRIFDLIRFIFQFYRDIGGYISNFLSNFSIRNSPKSDH